MAERHRAFDWHQSPLGPPEGWDTALKTLVPIMLASNQPMFVAWGQSRTLLYNDPYAEILANKHPAALGRDILEVWHEIRDALEPIVTTAYAGQSVQMDDIQFWVERRGYREEAHFSFSYSPVRADSGEIGGFFCACNETTAQIQAERRLAASEARHRGVLANMEEGFVLFDHEFTILEANPAAARLVDLTREQMLGRDHWAIFPNLREAPLGRMYRQALAEGRPLVMENSHVFPGGREACFEVRAFPVADGLAVLFQDITERKRLQQEAAESLERVQLALDAGAIVGTWVWLVPEDRVIADERFAESFGLDAEVLKAGAPIEYAFGAIHPDDRQAVQDAVARAVADRGRYQCQYRVFRGGAYRWVEANGRVEVDASGAPVRFPGVLLDVEERRRVEAERDRVTALLQSFIGAVPGVVFAKDRQGRYLMGNRGAAEALGCSPDEMIGRTDEDILPDHHEARALMARDRQIMESGTAMQAEEWVSRRDGTPAVWWSTKEPLRDASGEVIGLVGTTVDITERKSIEDALRLSEQRSALAIEVAQLGTWHWDVATSAVTADERCRQMCGLDAHQPAFTLADVKQHVHPDDWPQIELALQRALDPHGPGGYAEELRWVHADGRVVWTASRGSVLFDGEDDARRAVAMLGSVTDITERRQMIEALRQADRRKDEFLAMLAHELRNPLAPINTASHVLKLSGGEPQRVLEASEIIARQVGHLTRLVDDLLDVSRVTRGLVQLDRAPVDLRAVVATAIEQTRPIVQARRHELRSRIGAGPFTVLGDFHRLVQVVANLLNNAAKYTPQGGVIELELSEVGPGEAEPRGESGHAVLQVSDNGVGIAPEMIEQVFDLFTQAERTPDRTQGGLGIGLALVRSLVQLHEGEVSVRSQGLHRGSCFRVELPLSQAAQDAEVERPVPQTPGRGRVFIVDDNIDAVATLAEVLQLSGYTVATAHDARTVLARTAEGPPWDALILDIGLPDMTGYELAQRLREAPTTRHATLIALTGYGQSHDRVISRNSGFDHHLVKPADIPQLIEILARRAEAVSVE
jgi:PAS domain S-box-containing protein